MQFWRHIFKDKKYINEIQQIFLHHKWSGSQYSMPAPHFVKQAVILRNMIKDATFIETGTHIGSTAKFASKYSKIVYTLEPSFELFNIAKKNLSQINNVVLVNGTSEERFLDLISAVSGDVTLWLDGHYSGDATFKGKIETPIIRELEIIEANIDNFSNVVILIDDIRLFNKSKFVQSDYPSKLFLTNWAEKNNLEWEIEHDIFISKKMR